MTKQLFNFMNERVREIKALIVLALMLAFGLTACNSESPVPLKNEQNKSIDYKHPFAADGDSTSLKPPREPCGGGGSGC